MNVAEIFRDQVPGLVRQHSDMAARIGACLQFDFEGEGGGTWSVDLAVPGGSVLDGPAQRPDCVVRMEAAEFLRLSGRPAEEWIAAYLDGRIRVTGNMVVLLKMRKVLAGAFG